jgi:hypothetical protein
VSINLRDQKWDAKIIVVRDQGVDEVWDGKVKTLVYNTSTMEWEAQTAGSGGGGGGALSATTSSIETRSMPMKTVIDEPTSSITYVGEALTGTSVGAASWRIKRISVSGSVSIIEWADGDGLFNNVWNDRVSLSYS